MLMSSAAFLLVGNILIPIKLGYLTKYKSGLLGRRSNGWSVAKDVFDAALPCAFNKLCEESEWEVMTIFASMSGPAEAATWATMGFIWNVFEATTEAIGNACEMRVAYQLGKGRPDMAKLAGYKTMFLALVTSIWGSAIFTSLNSVLPSLLTKDATIQRMLLDLFPLLALSNVSMGFGMVAWTAVGGQGRNSLATKIAIACSFLVTCPIAGGEGYLQMQSMSNLFQSSLI
jgi:Na+-driven multidrug efflux pump